MIRNNSSITEIFNSNPKKFLLERNSIYLNEDVVLEVDIVNGIRWTIFGDPSSGKSYFLGVVLTQFKNNWMFDPTGKFSDTLEEQGVSEKWVQLELKKAQTKDSFKINVSDLHLRVLDSIFPKTEDTNKKRYQRQAIETFISRKQEKTYSDWVQWCKEYDLDFIKKDLDLIFSRDDSAPPILELAKGRKMINCEGMSVRNPAIGVAIQSLIGARSKLSKREVMKPENFIIISLDEAQDYARFQTPSGEAISQVGLQARKFGMGQITAGSAYNKIHPDIRAKSNLKFIFSSPGMTQKYKNEGIDIISSDWDKLEHNECFLYSDDGYYKGASGKDKCLPSLYYKDAKKLSKKSDSVIKKDKTKFPRRIKKLI